MNVKNDYYTNGEITVSWNPEKCVQSGVCYTHLRRVFNPLRRPWVDMNGAQTDQIINIVQQCPSGALSFVRNDDLESQSVHKKAE